MTQRDANTIRILIADDDAQTRASLKKLLSSESDFKVVGTASSGKEAIYASVQLVPRIILIDSDLADIDGFKTTEKIIQLNHEARIVLLIESNTGEKLQKALLSGARFAINKPINPERLYAAIRGVDQQYTRHIIDYFPNKKST